MRAPNDGQRLGAAAQYLHLGIQLGVTVVLFTLGGYWLDNRFGTSPFGVAGGAFLGITIGLYHFIRATIRTEQRNDGNGQ